MLQLHRVDTEGFSMQGMEKVHTLKLGGGGDKILKYENTKVTAVAKDEH